MAEKDLFERLRELKARLPSLGEALEQHAIESDSLDRFYHFPKARLLLDEWLGYCTVFSMNKARNVDYFRKIKYSSDENLYLNVCTPEKRKGEKLPVFIYIHGGGWVSGRPEDREAFVSRIAASGFVTFNIFYGYSPEYAHPAPLVNIYEALGWIKENADKYGADMSEVYVGGESAGAHLASMVGAVSSNEDYKNRFTLDPRSRDMKFAGLVLNCGVYDINLALKSGFKFISSYIYAYYGKSLLNMADDPDAETMSTVSFVTKDFPKSFIITAENDPLKICGTEMIKVFLEKGVSYEHFHAEGSVAVHAFAVAQVLDISKEAMAGILQFMGVSETDAAEQKYLEIVDESMEKTEKLGHNTGAAALRQPKKRPALKGGGPK